MQPRKKTTGLPEITRVVAICRGHGITHREKTTSSRGPGEVPTSPHRPQCSPKKTRARETQTSPTRRQRSPKQTRVQSAQTSPAYRRRSTRKTRAQAAQTSPVGPQRSPQKTGSQVAKLYRVSSHPGTHHVKYLAECELATDSEDGVEDRPLFRRVFQNPEAAKASTADSYPMDETEEDDLAVQSTSHAPTTRPADRMGGRSPQPSRLGRVVHGGVGPGRANCDNCRHWPFV